MTSTAASIRVPGSTDTGGRGIWGTVAALLGIVLAVLAIYVGAAYALADRVPFNTSVAGVAIGGTSETDAVARLEAEVGAQASAPVPVSVGTVEDSLEPADAGLAVDTQATVTSVTGFSLRPERMWQHIVGAGRVPLTMTVDDEALSASLTALAGRVDILPVEGDVVFAAGVPEAVAPVEGSSLDVAGALEAVKTGWLLTDGPIPLPIETVPVAVGQAAVEAALAQAQGVVSAPLSIVVADREVVVAPEAFAAALGYEPTSEGTLALTADGDALRAAVLQTDPETEVAPKDAAIVLAGGAPSIVPGTVGRVLDAVSLSDAALVALAPGGDRRAVVAEAAVEPEFSTADAEALGIREVVSTFSTNYPDDPGRTENLSIAAGTISGTVLRPGDVFSLNDILGERTTAKGYNAAGTIIGGRLAETVGGGVSQMATTVYNGAFFAGLEVLTFQPHSFYISRYPEGRESTMNWNPRIDMDFRNDTATGILVQASVGGGQVTVTFWGTKTWDVESVTSPRRNAKQPDTIYDPDPGCVSQRPNPGFTVDVTRIWRQGGAEVKREKETTNYSAADQIICGSEPAALPTEPVT